jgi:hypothetical protein
LTIQNKVNLTCASSSTSSRSTFYTVLRQLLSSM